MGYSVSEAGDVNGDGLGDLVIGAPYTSYSGRDDNTGEIYVVFGKNNTTPLNLNNIARGIGGFVIHGIIHIGYGSSAGFSVSSAGDINGDGLDDLIIGAPDADPNGRNRAGESYVVFGKNDTVSVNLIDIALGVGGFKISGVAAFDKSGFSVSGAGDINGDSLDDLIIGAPYASPDGNSYVVFGKQDTRTVTLSEIARGQGGFILNGIEQYERFGHSVSGAGDVNGDGLNDLIIGGYTENGESISTIYVVFGKNNTTAVNIGEIGKGIGGFAIIAIKVNDYAGNASVSGAGDINGDGLDDLIIGAPVADPNSKEDAGESYVVFGKNDTTAVEVSEVVRGVGGFVITSH
ncbi:Integrin alpha chain [Beggiatoa sp. SS]|nr:Integrin alpha chain [Beggiatoa sp. SS]